MTVPGYLTFALLTGALRFLALATLFGARSPEVALADRRGAVSGVVRQEGVLALDRLGAGDSDAGERDRAGGACPASRSAAYRGEFRAAGDRLPDRAQARLEAAPHRFSAPFFWFLWS